MYCVPTAYFVPTVYCIPSAYLAAYCVPHCVPHCVESLLGNSYTTWYLFRSDLTVYFNPVYGLTCVIWLTCWVALLFGIRAYLQFTELFLCSTVHKSTFMFLIISPVCVCAKDYANVCLFIFTDVMTPECREAWRTLFEYIMLRLQEGFDAGSGALSPWMRHDKFHQPLHIDLVNGQLCQKGVNQIYIAKW